MDSSPLTLQPKTLISEAISHLAKAGVEAAPVVDEHNELLGFISTHDVLVELWCRDYADLKTVPVKAVMKSDVMTVHPSDSVLHMAEYMCIDHDQLYPVTSAGMVTSLISKTTVDRAREMQVNRPRQYPVVKDDKLVGMISRQHVISALHGLLCDTEQAPALAKTA